MCSSLMYHKHYRWLSDVFLCVSTMSISVWLSVQYLGLFISNLIDNLELVLLIWTSNISYMCIKWLSYYRFALKHFMVASAFLSTCAATYINAHYRKVVKLRNQAFVTTLLPVIIAPSLLGGMFHHQVRQTHSPLDHEVLKCKYVMVMNNEDI